MGVCCIAYQPRSEKGRAKPLNKAAFGAAASSAIATLLTCSPAAAQSADINILFVGNSFTHGRYDPALNYNGGAANSPGDSLVHDLLCPSLTASGACTSGTGAVAPVLPTSTNTPGGTLQGQLNYLQANPSSQYTEVGPFSGVAGVFLQFTKEAGLHYNVSLVAVSSATLTGYLNNTGSEAGDLPLIANSKWNQMVLSDQSFRPLPTTVTVNGASVPTRGSPSGFQSGVNGLVNAIDTADTAAGTSKAAVTLYETQPIASYGYTSTNPNAPIFGSSTPAQQGGNPAYAPYVGAANPIAQMASDLHNAYTNEATSYNSANPNGSRVGVALAGDGWVSAVNLGIAVQNPYLTNNPASKVDLWDSNPLTACCTTPIGYHPSAYGAYLNALSIFYKITGIDPVTLDAEANPNNPLFLQSAANALGISANDAQLLAIAAADTVRAGGPVSNFELQTGKIYAVLTGGAGLIKDGPGTVTLTATNTYTGATTVNGGTLEVDGSIASSSLVTVNAGGILSGTGIVDPAVTTITSGGVLAPGNPSNPTGMLTITGNLAFQAGAFYLVQVNGAAAGSVSVTGGTATPAGATVDAVFAGSAGLVKQYTILTATGGVSGTFAPTVVNTNLPRPVGYTELPREQRLPEPDGKSRRWTRTECQPAECCGQHQQILQLRRRIACGICRFVRHARPRQRIDASLGRAWDGIRANNFQRNERLHVAAHRSLHGTGQRLWRRDGARGLCRRQRSGRAPMRRPGAMTPLPCHQGTAGAIPATVERIGGRIWRHAIDRRQCGPRLQQCHQPHRRHSRWRRLSVLAGHARRLRACGRRHQFQCQQSRLGKVGSLPGGAFWRHTNGPA